MDVRDEAQPDKLQRGEAQPEERGRRRRLRETSASFGEDMAGQAPPLDSDAWRRVHKITPVLNIWQVLAVVFGVVLFNLLEMVRDLSELDGLLDGLLSHWMTVLGIALGALFVLVLLTWIYSWLAWKRMRYAVDDRAVYLHRGLIAKQQRMARLNRVQAVDLEQPLLARLFKLARLKVEVAGGSDSSIDIEYLALAEAERVRAEILARAAGIDVDAHPAGDPREVLAQAVAEGDLDPAAPVVAQGEVPAEGVETAGAPASSALRGLPGVTPEKEMFRVPTGRLIGSVFMDLGIVISVIAFVVGVALMIVTGASLFTLAAFGPALLAAGSFGFQRVAGEWGHRAAVSADGIRLRRGLLSTRNQTLPPGRIQAVRLKQGLLWRLMGWWRVQVNVAGYGSGSEDGSGLADTQTVLLPVGRREDALTAMWMVLDDVGTDDPFATLDAALSGHGDAQGFLTSPGRAKWLDPLTYRHNGLLITRTAMIIRSGRFTRTVIVVPHQRTQSLAVTQGPLERRLNLTDVVSHSVTGPISEIRAIHLEAATAGQVLMAQAERARSARASESPEDWQRRMGLLGEPQRNWQ